MTIVEFLEARIQDEEDAAQNQPYLDAQYRIIAECNGKRNQLAVVREEMGAYAETYLRNVAAAYADHPDYNPAWKVK